MAPAGPVADPAPRASSSNTTSRAGATHECGIRRGDGNSLTLGEQLLGSFPYGFKRVDQPQYHAVSLQQGARILPDCLVQRGERCCRFRNPKVYVRHGIPSR